MNRLSILLSAFLLTLISACSQDSNKNKKMNYEKKPEQVKYYNESAPQLLTASVSSELGVLVQIDSPKDFSSEFKYNRMLQILKRNAPVIKANLGGVSKILITNSTSVRGEIGNILISLSYDLDETNVIKLFQTGVQELKDALIISKELSNKIGVSINDDVGVTPSNVSQVSEKLVNVSRQVEFFQDPTFRTLTLGNYFAVTSDGAIINIGADSTDIVTQLKEMISARNQWRIEILPLLANFGLQVTFQPGVLNAVELLKSIANLKQNLVIFKSTLTQFNQVVIGKRWDYDYANKVILADYSVTGEELRKILLDVNPVPDAIQFTQARKSLIDTLSQKGLILKDIIIDLPRTQSSLMKLQKFEADFLAYPKIANIEKLNISILNIQETSDTAITLVHGTHTLFLNLPISISTIESYLAQSVLTDAYNFEKFQLEDTVAKLNLKLDLQLKGHTALTIDRLHAVNNWLATGELSPEMISILNIKYLQIIATNDIQNYPTQLKDTYLILNMFNFQPEQMKNIIKKPVPPAPTPTTTPVPTLTPAPRVSDSISQVFEN